MHNLNKSYAVYGMLDVTTRLTKRDIYKGAQSRGMAEGVMRALIMRQLQENGLPIRWHDFVLDKYFSSPRLFMDAETTNVGHGNWKN